MQRIQKFLAQYGIASRRTIEDWIKLQRIKIDGKIAKVGDQINGSEEIRLDNKILEHKNFTNTDNAIKIILYHKPAGKICTRSDPKNRPTVFTDLPELTIGRWVAIGRLDLNTSGILLFTNNGDVANKLMHPRYNQEREYLVRIFGKATSTMLSNLTNGVKLEDGISRFKKITFVNQKSTNSWYKVILTEGKNREIKRLFASQGLIVNRLIRIRFGDIVLPKTLQTGEYIPIKVDPQSL
ncbi:MAG: pseudouridine synthase [Gammaproteobacteria bacterium]|jgi:23S rRNA pseudouridine2605 synthase